MYVACSVTRCNVHLKIKLQHEQDRVTSAIDPENVVNSAF